MNSILLLLAAALCIITALIHSFVGEKRLISPLIKSNHGVMTNPLAKEVIRFAWHWTSALWFLIAAYLGLVTFDEKMASPLLLWAIGLVHIAAGLFDALITKGKHIGWPPITAIGVLISLGMLS
ncbi:hypothetical protein [Hirschia maritima]|uniref:hypothetical protein n=1 Tax=Hirschia maritima TaxID=1121961 RepID=UPI0003759E2A|nr:hypothetical protein [Hirschia maritima]